MGQHFDDLLVYRTVSDIVKRANLSARPWPDPLSATFDSPTVAAALGQQGTVSPGDLGVTTLDFGRYNVSGFSGGTTATNLTFDNSPGAPGIGVGGGSGNSLSSQSGDWVRIDLDDKATRFAFTLSDFGKYPNATLEYIEQVEVKFFDATTLVGTAFVKPGCNADGGLASFSIEPTAVFNRVEITPLAATEVGGTTSITAFLLSEIRACVASETTCVTTLSQPPNAPNTCP